ncbi:MAG: YeeE/YedE family protein [Granulosicoccus sp.]
MSFGEQRLATCGTARMTGLGKPLSLIILGITLVLATSIFAGVRYGLMLAVGLGFGLVLEGLRFGFAGPWRAMILRRDPSGLLAQLLAIGIVAMVALPLIAARGDELTGAQAPIGLGMIAGAFIFGAAMQVVLGCGSGTLVNAGSGNPVSLLALPFFAAGSFAGAWHLFHWSAFASLPPVTLTGWYGAGLTVAMLVLVAVALWKFAAPEYRVFPRRYLLAALAIALLALLNLVIAGQPWGVVYGLGLWAAKGATALGADLSSSAFWTAPSTVERIQASLLTDYTSLTNIGIIVGAFIIANWRSSSLSKALPRLPARAWFATILAGFLLGYSSRLAFGCNVGAFFSGISTGSLHGWVWFVAAFLGSFAGIRLRYIAGLEARP